MDDGILDYNIADYIETEDSGLSSPPPPPPGRKGILLHFDLRLYRLCDVNQADGVYTVDFAVTTTWIDQRIAGLPEKDLDFIDFDQVWKPSWRITGTTAAMFVQDDAMEVIDEHTGLVKHYKRLRASRVCELDFTSFPFDHQELEMVLRVPRPSKQGIAEVVCLPSQIDLTKRSIHHMEYRVLGVKSGPQEACGGSKPEVHMKVVIRREQSYWLYAIIVPNLAIAVAGCMSYLNEPDTVDESWYAGRLMTIFEFMLTFIYFKIDIEGRLPALDYLTLLDYYLLGLFLVFFLSASQCTLVCILLRYGGYSMEDLGVGDIYFMFFCVILIFYSTIRFVLIPHQLSLQMDRDAAIHDAEVSHNTTHLPSYGTFAIHSDSQQYGTASESGDMSEAGLLLQHG